jgi:acyl-CoA reductase-like NAD-dependent aldehyde dehydrogenase
MPTFDPTTEEKIAEVAKATPVDADEAVKAASEAFESGPWARMHHEARAKILFRMADLLDERADEFAIREAMDMGMPATMGEGRTIINVSYRDTIFVQSVSSIPRAIAWTDAIAASR